MICEIAQFLGGGRHLRQRSFDPRKFRGETQKRTEKSIALQLDFLDSMIWWCGGQWVYCPFSLNMKRVSPLVTVADNDVMHFQQGGKSILRRLTFATLFMRHQEQNEKKT